MRRFHRAPGWDILPLGGMKQRRGPMIQSSCHCGAVRLVCETAPTVVTDCNCSICRRYGALWAYYSPGQVQLIPPQPPTDVYMWGDEEIEFHRCRVCGCLTHWTPADKGRDRMGVNVRLMPLELLTQLRVRRLDGADTWRYLDED
jgi:hypothetical protein